ncbi:MAG TPA: hypothetical protein VGM33_26710 [Baekduia sp.]
MTEHPDIATTTVEYLTAWATAGTAVGTVILAAATFWMARKTRDAATATQDDVRAAKEQLTVAQAQIELSRRQADAAEAAISAQLKPVLIDVPFDMFREGGTDAGTVSVELNPKSGLILVDIPLRNVGPGLARVTGLSLDTGSPIAFGATLRNANIPPGERARFMFTAAPEQSGYSAFRDIVDRRGTFSVAVRYTDAAGAQDSLTRADLHWNDAISRWYVRQIFTSGPGAAHQTVGSAPVYG